MLSSVITAILLLLPKPNPAWNESDVEYRSRVRLIATAITIASHDDYSLAMAVVVLFNGESHFSPSVQAGLKRGDSGKAICLGNNHQNKLSKEQWESLAGIDQGAVLRCSIITAARLERDLKFCQSFDPYLTYANAMVLYGTGRTCTNVGMKNFEEWNMFDKKAEQWRNLLDRKKFKQS